MRDNAVVLYLEAQNNLWATTNAHAQNHSQRSGAEPEHQNVFKVSSVILLFSQP